MRIKLIDKDKTYLPEYKTCGAAGADLKSRGPFVINPGQIRKIPLGICFEIPVGYEVQIRPRSGLSSKGIIVILGTVDSDYRGEVCALVYNATHHDYFINDGDRIAQMVYAPVVQTEFETVEELTETDRGNGGFGSTGV